MTAGVREAALSSGAIGFLVSDWMETQFNLPEADVPDLSLYSPEVAARVLRQEWSLGERPISNMTQLLESRGIRVFSLSEDTAKMNAFSIWRNQRPFVFLNTFKSAESSRFDAAHELGHLVLHQDGASTGSQRVCIVIFNAVVRRSSSLAPRQILARSYSPQEALASLCRGANVPFA